MIIAKISQEKIEIILNNPQKKATELAKELNIAVSTVRRYWRENGIYISKYFNPDKDEFINKYLELKSRKAIQEYYNKDHHTIADYCKKIGFDETPYLKKKITKEEHQFIVDNYNNYSATELSEITGIGRDAISGIWFREKLRNKKSRTYYIHNEDYFEIIDSQEKAYFLGFIGADGCLFKTTKKYKQNILRITIQKNDIKILELLKRELQTSKPIYTNNKYAILEISSDKLFNDIKNKKISCRKTYGNCIANVPDKYMIALIRGYIDGDGCIGKNNSQSDIGNISIAGYKNNLDIIQDFLLKYNIIGCFIKDNRKYKTNEFSMPFGALTYSNRCMKYCLLKLLYENSNNFYLDRKYEIAEKFINYVESSDNVRDKQIVIYYNYAVQKVY